MEFKLLSILIVTFLAASINCTSEDFGATELEENLELSHVENTLNTDKTTDIREQDEIIAHEDESDIAKILNYQEADDMEYGGIFQNRTVFVDTEPVKQPKVEEMIISDPIPSNLKYDVEWIESSDGNTVDIDEIHSKPLHLVETWPSIITMTALGAMFIIILIGSVLFYKLLTKRYTNRQILINEEDMIDPNDMKHFSL